MKIKTLNLSLPIELVDLIDVQANLCFETRSGYIKRILVADLRKKGALDVYKIKDPEKTYQTLRRQRLQAYLSSLKLKDYNEYD